MRRTHDRDPVRFSYPSLVIETDDYGIVAFNYVGLTVADFYESVMHSLGAPQIEIPILARPYDTFTDIPFAADRTHRLEHPDVLRSSARFCARSGRFETFRGRYKGKSSPVHVFWQSFDLALTRFPGRAAPLASGPAVAREAYSHEAISVGFWAGDAQFPDAAFLQLYLARSARTRRQPLSPPQAVWDTSRGSQLALLYYRDVRTQPDPAAMLLAFLESAYVAGARRAGWPTPS